MTDNPPFSVDRCQAAWPCQILYTPPGFSQRTGSAWLLLHCIVIIDDDVASPSPHSIQLCHWPAEIYSGPLHLVSKEPLVLVIFRAGGWACDKGFYLIYPFLFKQISWNIMLSIFFFFANRLHSLIFIGHTYYDTLSQHTSAHTDNPFNNHLNKGRTKANVRNIDNITIYNHNKPNHKFRLQQRGFSICRHTDNDLCWYPLMEKSDKCSDPTSACPVLPVLRTRGLGRKGSIMWRTANLFRLWWLRLKCKRKIGQFQSIVSCFCLVCVCVCVCVVRGGVCVCVCRFSMWGEGSRGMLAQHWSSPQHTIYLSQWLLGGRLSWR